MLGLRDQDTVYFPMKSAQLFREKLSDGNNDIEDINDEADNTGTAENTDAPAEDGGGQ